MPLLGVVNGPSKNVRLAKFKPNSRGLVISYFYGRPSRSLAFFFNAKEVSGSQKMYQSRRLAKSRIYHSTPLLFPLSHMSFLPLFFCLRVKLRYFPSYFAVLRYFPNCFAVMLCSATANVPRLVTFGNLI